MPTLRSKAIHLASTLPKGDTFRKSLLSVLASDGIALVPAKAGIPIEKLEGIQASVREFVSLFGTETRMTTAAEDVVIKPAAKEAERIFDHAKDWKLLGKDFSRSSSFKTTEYGIEFPNGQRVGEFNYDDTYEDDRFWGRGVVSYPPQAGKPAVQDPGFIDWYFTTQIRLPPTTIPASFLQPLYIFFDKVGIEPRAWWDRKRTTYWDSGKQGYFFKLMLKKAGEDLKGMPNVKVTKYKVNLSKNMDAKGQRFVSSVNLDVEYMHPDTKEWLLKLSFITDFNGLLVDMECNEKYTVGG